MTIVYCPIYHLKFKSAFSKHYIPCFSKHCIPCFSKHCIPCFETFNSALVYYVESANDYIQSGKYKNLFDKKKNTSSTQTDLNYITIDCDGCEVKSPTNDWDIV